LAGLLKIGLPPEFMSRFLGTAAACATLFVCGFASRRLRGGDAWSVWDALPAVLLAGVPGDGRLSAGGLGAPAVALFVTPGATWYLRDQLVRGELRPASAVAFGLAALTRPEGLLFFALTAAHRGLVKIVARKLTPTRAELVWVGTFLAFAVPHLLWRRWYYGW